MSHYVSLPDNDVAFYSYVNLVINNRNNSRNEQDDHTRRPKNVGPVKVLTYTHNEVGEPFMVVESKKDEKFVEMIIDQFNLLRRYWSWVEEEICYPTSDKY